MYKKRNHFTNRAFDNKLAAICDKLIEQNPDVSFIISKKFVEKENGELGTEIIGYPVIISSEEISNLTIPSTYALLGYEYLTNWCDNYPLAKLVYSPIKFIDGEINGKLIPGLFLDIEKQDEIQKVLNYK